VPVGHVRDLAARWAGGFDWRAQEARLNAVPQFTTEIDGQRVHLLHARSPEPNALPLVLTHGWPGSVFEFLDVVGPLSDPRAHGGDPADAFHVVVPSLPGFGFSGPTREPGWTTRRTARAWVELMTRLGYDRFGAAGNDVGSLVSPEVGRFAPERVAGVHVTQVFSFPSGDPAEMADLSADDQARLDALGRFWAEQGAFNGLQSQQPQTLAFALLDSPVGQLAWNAQLMGDLDPDVVLANVTLYWLTRTAASAARSYYEDAHDPEPPATAPTTTPTGVMVGAGDFQSIRRFADRDHANIVRWEEFDRGGHYAALLAPDLYLGELRAFFRPLR
jgi:pimeloyl-ACP methyl ester carboxylesterase